MTVSTDQYSLGVGGNSLSIVCVLSVVFIRSYLGVRWCSIELSPLLRSFGRAYWTLSWKRDSLIDGFHLMLRHAWRKGASVRTYTPQGSKSGQDSFFVDIFLQGMKKLLLYVEKFLKDALSPESSSLQCMMSLSKGEVAGEEKYLGGR